MSVMTPRRANTSAAGWSSCRPRFPAPSNMTKAGRRFPLGLGATTIPCRTTPRPPTNDTSVMLTGSGSAAAGATGTATTAKRMAKVRRLMLEDMAGSPWSGTQTPTTVGIRTLATHPLQATVRIAFRRTPDQGQAGCSQVREVKVSSADERNDMEAGFSTSNRRRSLPACWPYSRQPLTTPIRFLVRADS
jgi:hypothetical protein